MRLREVYSQDITPFGTYDFRLTASLYATNWEFDGTYAYLGLIYDDEVILSILNSVGEVVKISYLASTNDSDLLERAIEDVRFIFGLDENLDDFYELARKDPLLRAISSDLRGIHLRTVQDIWDGLIIGICQQNTSFYLGWRSLIKLRRLYGKRIHLPKTKLDYYTYPRPESIINFPHYLKKTGVGYRAKIILNAAQKYLSTNGEIENLEELKYIGPYTSAIAKIIALRDYSVFPLDKWFTKLLIHVYFNDDNVTREELIKFIDKKWGRWKALAELPLTQP